MDDVSDRDDAAMVKELFGNVADSKSLAQSSPSYQLHPILMEDWSELSKPMKNKEIGNPTCKSNVHNNSVF